MKKLLGIVVLGLLWCSISNAQHELNQTKETGGLGSWVLACVCFFIIICRFFYMDLLEKEIIPKHPETRGKIEIKIYPSY